MSAAFDLRALAREVIDEDTSEDLAQMVKELRRRIPPHAVGTALDQALAAFMHVMIRNPGAGRARGAAPSGPSAKVTAIRDWWDRHRYAVADGSERRVGDMSPDDFIFVAEGLEQQAKLHAARAAWMRGAAGRMRELGAARFADLPDAEKRALRGKDGAP